MFVDSHAHLSGLSQDQLHTVLGNAKENGVDTILNVATNLNSCDDVLSQNSSVPGVTLLKSVGICPPEINTAPDNWDSFLEEKALQDGVVAIGEIGIDGLNESYPPIEVQRPFFVKQLQIAKDLGLPSLIHARGAEREALQTCVDLGVEKALFHCFTGTATEAEAIVEAGYVISFSGIVTFKNSDFDDVLRRIPSSQLLFETDSPYLSPVPYRGKVNEPCRVAEVYKYAALVRREPLELLSGNCISVFKTLFSL